MDAKLISKIRKVIAKARLEGGQRVRYPEFVKSSVRNLLNSGVSLSEISILIGVSSATLFKWSQKGSPAFHSVDVSKETESESESEPATAGLSIVMPSGIRIECSSAQMVSEILERLK